MINDMIKNKLLSIIINNYNYESYVNKAIESALNQTYPHVEVIVVDDGSTDNSMNVIKKYEDRTKVIFKSNGGQASALNEGFANSIGDYVLFLDADDVLYPEAGTVAIEQLMQMPGSPSVQFKLRLIDQEGVNLSDKSIPKMFSDSDPVKEMLERGAYNFSPTSGNLYKRTVLNYIFPIPENDYKISADVFIQTYVAFLGKPVRLQNRILGQYRIHGKNNYANQKFENLEVAEEKLVRNVKIEKLKSELIIDLCKRKKIKFPRRLMNKSGMNLTRRIYIQKYLPEKNPFEDDTLSKIIINQFLNIIQSKSINRIKINIFLMKINFKIIFLIKVREQAFSHVILK
jgi:glycosyltransferase involved in cell wall biosynthesis